MKTALLALFILCGTLAFGQAAGVQPLVEPPNQISDHPEHAIQHDMGTVTSVMEVSGSTWGHGERPLWEVAPRIPLGDIARVLRKEHETAKKARRCWSN